MVTTMMVLAAATLVGCGQPMAVVAPAAQRPMAQAQASTGDRLLTLAKNEIARFDTNRNGTLSSKEYVDGRFGDMRFIKAPTAAETATLKAGLAKTFAKLDTNKDGQLTAQELKAEYATN
jgi:hypothetical protein